jgi:hypothetical protein
VFTPVLSLFLYRVPVNRLVIELPWLWPFKENEIHTERFLTKVRKNQKRFVKPGRKIARQQKKE